jgi:hypothetical protein
MNLHELLEFTFLSGGFTTRSDTARENAELIAEAAIKGYLTTNTPRDGFCNVWRLSSFGLSSLWGGFLGEFEDALPL